MTQRQLCEWCGGIADVGATCPKSIACPDCHAAPGARCVRPSGHPTMELHHARVARAESTPATTRATGDEPDRHEQDRLFAPVQPTIPGSMSLDIP
jgi:hypothetical protein